MRLCPAPCKCIRDMYAATTSLSLYKQKTICLLIGKNAINLWLCVKDAQVYAV